LEFPSVRIVLIGNVAAHSTESCYAKAFETLGHQCEVIDSWLGSKPSFAKHFVITRFPRARFVASSLRRDRGIHRRVSDFSPHVIIVFKGESISNNLLKALTDDYSVSLFYPDAYRYLGLLRGRASQFEAIFTAANNKAKYSELGAKRVYTIPWACETGFHRRIELPRKYDVAFFGSPYMRRYRILRSLRRVEVFGSHWILPAGEHHHPVYDEDFVQTINASKINLNIQHPTDFLADAPSWRVFEVAGSGGFLLSDDIPSLRTYFPRVVTFRDIADLKDTIDWFLGNPNEAEEVSRSMHDICHEKHTFERRGESIVDLLG
jgi:spore maturation protein CgeB